MSGFYKIDTDGQLLRAVDGMATPSGVYAVADYDSYSYPIDGAWRYFASEAAALTHFSEPTDMTLVEYAADKRWRVETGGLVLGGVTIPTDDRAKLLLLGAAQSMADGTSAPFVVNGVNHGSYSKAQFLAINSAVVAHVQATFASLAAALAGIEAGTITTQAEVDSQF